MGHPASVGDPARTWPHCRDPAAAFFDSSMLTKFLTHYYDANVDFFMSDESKFERKHELQMRRLDHIEVERSEERQ